MDTWINKNNNLYTKKKIIEKNENLSHLLSIIKILSEQKLLTSKF